MLLMTKAVNTRKRLTMGKGVAVRTVFKIFSVFSVTKLISGSRKYSEATQRPFSRPAKKQTLQRPACRAILTSVVWFCGSTVPSSMYSQ